MSTYRTSCGETLEKLPLYVGDDLDPEAMASVRGHLETCPACARRARLAQRARADLTGSLRAPLAGSAGSSLWPSLRSTLVAEGLIRTERKAGSPLAATRGGRGRLQWLAPLAAAAVVVAVLGGMGLLGPDRPTQIAPPLPEVALPTEEASFGGSLQRIDPRDVESTVPFQAGRPALGQQRWLSPAPVSAAGYRR